MKQEHACALNSIVECLKNNDNFLIVSHISPDGDTLGSASALCGILKLLGKNCIHVCDGEPSHNLKNMKQLTEHMGEPNYFDVAIAVDCADFERLGKYGQNYNTATLKIVIDHHKTNIGFADINYVCDYPACAQCICDIVDKLDIKITSDIALCLYVAFLTDTGRFSYKGVNSDTMQCVARLYGYGLDIDRINRNIFNLRSYIKSKLIAQTLNELECWIENAVFASFLEFDQFAPFNTEGCDTEGIVNYILDIEGCKIAIFAHENLKNVTKISFRSTDVQYDVSAIASHFGGGGHTLAAGCTMNVSCADAKKLIYSYIKDNLFC